MQELTTAIKSTSVPKGHSYPFHMLKAAANLKQNRAKLALEELELAELSEHSAGKQQGDILLSKAACFHKLECHDLAKECLFQSSVVRTKNTMPHSIFSTRTTF